MAPIRQSRQDYGLGFQYKVRQNLSTCSLFARKRWKRRLQVWGFRDEGSGMGHDDLGLVDEGLGSMGFGDEGLGFWSGAPNVEHVGRNSWLNPTP